MTNIPSQYQPLVQRAASALGIDPNIVAEQIYLESSWNPNATSATGAQGLFQFEPGTFSEFGSGSPFNPDDEINAYIKFMGSLLQQFGGDVTKALAAYNAGPGNISAGMGYAQTILSRAGSGGGSTTTNGPVANVTDAAGVSLQNSPVGSFTAATPTLSLDALRAQSPLVAALVQSIPELQDIFQKAVAESWTPDKFTSAVQNSDWWASHSASARTALATMKSDPATWNESVTNLQSKLTSLGAQYGANLTTAQAYSIAVDALTNGYDTNDSIIRQKFEQYITPVSGLHYGGEAGNNETAIRQAQMDLGVFLPESTLDNNIQQIGGGQMSVNDVTSNLRSLAAATYPAYAQQINQGMSVSDIAAPYTSRAQQLLEGGDGMINIQSPLIKKALQNVDKKTGQPTPMPLGDFENAVRQDPRWRATDNAQNDVMQQAHTVLQNFGFAY